MCEHLHYFEAPSGCTAVALPFELDTMLAAWSALRTQMVRRKSASFTRDEWTYLITFLDAQHLQQAFTQSFGARAAQVASTRLTRFARPRGPVAIWLPNNISLLGPLTLILLLLTGNPIRLKGGSTSEDLTGAFLAYVREHDSSGILRTLVDQQVRYEVFGRDDVRNLEMAAEATMRIVFGTDEAAAAVHAFPHPLGSVGFSHSDRRSEAWIEADAITDDLLAILLRVFAIYGQAGCTSPSRVVLLDQSVAQAVALRDRLAAHWSRLRFRDVPPHIASTNVMARQWAAGCGWDAVLTQRNQAVLAAGDGTLTRVPSPMLLPIVAATTEEATASLPANMQTLGHAVVDAGAERWLRLLARNHVKRFVPIAHMHHFGPLWDSEPYWMQAFELVQIEVEQ